MRHPFGYVAQTLVSDGSRLRTPDLVEFTVSRFSGAGFRLPGRDSGLLRSPQILAVRRRMGEMPRLAPPAEPRPKGTRIRLAEAPLPEVMENALSRLWGLLLSCEPNGIRLSRRRRPSRLDSFPSSPETYAMTSGVRNLGAVGRSAGATSIQGIEVT
jgi:hypothetical protein